MGVTAVTTAYELLEIEIRLDWQIFIELLCEFRNKVLQLFVNLVVVKRLVSIIMANAEHTVNNSERSGSLFTCSSSREDQDKQFLSFDESKSSINFANVLRFLGLFNKPTASYQKTLESVISFDTELTFPSSAGQEQADQYLRALALLDVNEFSLEQVKTIINLYNEFRDKKKDSNNLVISDTFASQPTDNSIRRTRTLTGLNDQPSEGKFNVRNKTVTSLNFFI